MASGRNTVWMTTLRAIKSSLLEKDSVETYNESIASLTRTVHVLAESLQSLSSRQAGASIFSVAGSAEEAYIEEVRKIVSDLTASSEIYIELFAALHPKGWSEKFMLDGGDLTEAQKQYIAIVKQYIMTMKLNHANMQLGLMWLCSSAVNTIPDFVSEIEFSTLASELPKLVYDGYLMKPNHDERNVHILWRHGECCSCAENSGEYYAGMLSGSILGCLVNLCRGFSAIEKVSATLFQPVLQYVVQSRNVPHFCAGSSPTQNLRIRKT